MTYSTRQINYPGDKKFLTNILDKYLEFRKGSKSTIEWNFESDLPNAGTGRILLYKDKDLNEHQVGSLNVLGRTFLINQKHYRASLLGDFVVELNHRTLAPAVKLSKDIANHALEDSVFIYGFPNKKAFPVLKLSGFKSIGLLTRYACITNYSIFLPRVFQFPIIPFFIGAAIDLIKGSYSHFVNLLCLNDYKIEEVNKFGSDFDKLIKSSELNHLIANTRSSAYLNWRYFKNPEHDYSVFICKEINEKSLNGYVVLEFEHDIVHIRDIFASTRKHILILLKAVKEIALNKSCSVISFSYLGDYAVVGLLKKSGFKPRESIRHFIIKTNNQQLLEKLSNKHNWFIVDGDEDQ